MELALVFLLGILAGFVIAWIVKPKPIGNLRVDHSDPESPYLFLEFTTNPSVVYSKKEVVLSVRIEDYIPHK